MLNTKQKIRKMRIFSFLLPHKNACMAGILSSKQILNQKFCNTEQNPLTFMSKDVLIIIGCLGCLNFGFISAATRARRRKA